MSYCDNDPTEPCGGWGIAHMWMCARELATAPLTQAEVDELELIAGFIDDILQANYRYMEEAKKPKLTLVHSTVM